GGGGGGGGGQAPQIEAEVSETALVLEDGTEVEAEVVLKDAELDLAFIRPKDKSAKLDFVELKQQDKAPQVLDDIFTVGRLGRVANRAISVTAGSIKSVVKGPRSFYVTDDAVSSGATGCLAYAADGTPIGVFVTKVYRPAEAAGGGGMRGGRGGGEVISVIRSVNDVIELAKQAKTAKAPEKKDGDKPEKKSDDQPKSDEKPKAPEKKKSDDKKGDDF
ncbi:MAG TPA: serine protease, partial [Planctomycetota bacterium]|nr:serine protease [Planctomycetota bacterium]